MELLIKDHSLKGPLQDETIEKLLSDVSRRIGQVRVEVRGVVQEKHKDRVPQWVGEAERIAKNVRKETNEIDQEAKRVEKLLSDWNDAWNVDSLRTIHSELAAADARLKKLRPLADIHDTLETLESLERYHKRDYKKRASLVMALDDSLRRLTTLSDNEEKNNSTTENDSQEVIHIQPSMLKTLRDDLIIRKESLTYDLYEEWGETFRCDVDKENSNWLYLNVGPQFDQVANALETVDLLSKKMDHLAKCLLNYILIPLLKDRGSRLRSVDSGKDSHAQIILQKPIAEEKGQDVAVSLDDCLKIFKLLKCKVGAVFVKNLVEGYILKPLKECIVESVLKPAVPSDEKETPNFNRLLASCDGFLREMKSAGLVSEENSSFEHFAANTDVIFLAKRCQSVLDKARELIAAALHKTVQVGGDSSEKDGASVLTKCVETMRTQETEREARETTPLRFDLEKPLPPLSEFPRCCVSESVTALLELIIKTLNDAANSDKPLSAARFYYCSRNMVELYLDLVPAYHEQPLKTLPQLTAVFYNNCYFLCHHLLTLGLQYESKLLPLFGVPAGVISVSFVDFIPRLKELAGDYIESQLETQKRYLVDCLKPANGFTNVSHADRQTASQKALKACALQFQHMHRIWSQVLPPPLLLKFQGILCGELLGHIVKAVVRLEDIGADEAELLHKLLNDLLNELHNCFVIDKVPYIHRYCEDSYYKYKELLFVLNASLVDIDDRWAAGHGPLAHWMDALDVKQLIRALFQNTDKRAALISKIK